jgi:hypothetical protein
VYVGYFQDRFSWTICTDWLWTMILLICASWAARITGVNHQCLAYSNSRQYFKGEKRRLILTINVCFWYTLCSVFNVSYCKVINLWGRSQNSLLKQVIVFFYYRCRNGSSDR